MDILRLLDRSPWVKHYEFQDFQQWPEGCYYKLKIVFTNQSVLFAREYMDGLERNYAFHWQDKDNNLIMRWDNAPHHHQITTFPHHKHTWDQSIIESTEITLQDVMEAIQKRLGNYSISNQFLGVHCALQGNETILLCSATPPCCVGFPHQ